ncbi:MAG TPA: HD domain-containing phosphohydrolase [Actinomycetota bacterium]|nr:HD domain-containing phosphohydrolase [Actinomycetota bacterium]
MPPDELGLADLLAALSVTTDLAMGQEPEKAIRATVLATELARHLDLSEREVADVYYTTLLKHLGCTATSHEETHLFGPDDLGMRRVAERTDPSRRGEVLELMRTTGRGAGLGRVRYLARAATGGKQANRAIFRAICEVGAGMAERLGLGEEVRRGVFESLERWDGKDGPQGLRGDDIALAARIAEPATQAVIFHRLGGTEAAREMVRRRSGGMFDPTVAEAFRAVGPRVLERLDEADPWAAVLEAEPQPVRLIGPDRVDTVAEVFADMVDLKTPFTLGHSTGVAELASIAAERLGLTEPGMVRRAGLLHDLGRTAVSTGVWEKPGSLSTSEWERVRLHAYQTERILARSKALEPLARIAGMHHERQDGSGYHHGASGGEVPAEARLLAAADAFHSMTEERPHRPARRQDEVAEILSSEAGARRFDLECVRAVLEAAGRPVPARAAWPAGLSDREVEVLRLVARGLSNKEVAAALVISPRTAEHHVQHVYAKIGASSRAGAAMFAMEHGLLRT